MSSDGDGRAGAGCLFVVSLAFGYLVGYGAHASGQNPVLWVIGGVICYAALAGTSVAISERMWRWSHGADSPKQWDREERAWVGAFWPVTLPFYVVASLFFWLTRS